MPMDKDLETQEIQQQAEVLDETIIQIIGQPKRQYSQQEIDEARQNLALMNDRVFPAHFIDNKNNHNRTCRCGTKNSRTTAHTPSATHDCSERVVS